MKSAIILCGNVRTFLMSYNGISLLDRFINEIVLPNNSDVFIFTDTNDFYHNGIQYFSNMDEIHDNLKSRLSCNVSDIDTNLARNIIFEKLSKIGKNIKDIVIEDPYIIMDNNKKYLRLFKQLRKIKKCFELLQRYEILENIKYDLILRWRFDNTINGVFDFSNYNDADAYSPGIHGSIIYDFYILGNRRAMDLFLPLHDRIHTFLDNGRIYMCTKCQYCGNDESHKCHIDSQIYEISYSLEYQIYKLFHDNNIKIRTATYQSSPYRYNNG